MLRVLSRNNELVMGKHLITITSFCDNFEHVILRSRFFSLREIVTVNF